MSNSSFYFKWGPFLLGFFFGIFGVIAALFISEERRDRVYSALLGLGINLVISLLVLKFYGPLPGYQ